MDGESQRAFQPWDPGCVVCTYAGELWLNTQHPASLLLALCVHLKSKYRCTNNKCPVCFIRHSPWTTTCTLSYHICFSISLPFFPPCCYLLFLFSVPGQSSGAFLHTLPCLGGWSNIPCTGQGWEDSRKQARAWAEAQHHFSALLQFRASGSFPPPGDG